ncbi:MAG: hypothetical protein IE926_10090 [Micrococcales bacterium]|uniref:hypothetical protein n=1 Tax=Phycicoccus sp. TaxID=1902410 RepID=UPI001991A2B5|nr:hypothetical protein [Phycicoccus sp.]MBD3783286.1 hypothetical protein [Micrococcales bacterium]HMM94607.1 hypothetical protein [Phycicoccus sp.]
MGSSFTYTLSVALLVLHLVPPAVGLALVSRSPSRRAWRTWALLFFGLSLLSGLAQTALTGSYWVGGLWGMEAYPVVAVLQLFLSLLSLAGAAAGVMAVVADRSED